jgi:hypothetical protein
VQQTTSSSSNCSGSTTDRLATFTRQHKPHTCAACSETHQLHGARGRSSGSPLLSTAASNSTTCGSAVVPAFHLALIRSGCSNHHKVRKVRERVQVKLYLGLSVTCHMAQCSRVTQEWLLHSPATFERLTRLTCTHFRRGWMCTRHKTFLNCAGVRAMKLFATFCEYKVARNDGSLNFRPCTKKLLVCSSNPPPRKLPTRCPGDEMSLNLADQLILHIVD